MAESQSNTNILLNVSTDDVNNEVHVLREDQTRKRNKMESSFEDDRDVKDMMKEMLFRMNFLSSGMKEIKGEISEIKGEISEIKDSIKSVAEKVDRHDVMISDLRVDVDNNSKDVTEMKSTVEACAEEVTFHEKWLRESDDQIEDVQKRMKVLEWKSIEGEARSRRQNGIVWDVPETEKESCKDDCKHCREAVEKIFREDLKMGSRNIPLQRVHRFPTSRGGATHIGKKANKPRGIMVAFRDYRDKLDVLKAAAQAKVKVSEDHPKAIRDARSSLMDDVRAARSSNPPKKATIAWPAKLYVEGKLVKEVNVVEHARKNASKK